LIQGVRFAEPQKIILAPPSTEAAAAVFFPSRPLSHKENRPTPPRFPKNPLLAQLSLGNKNHKSASRL